MRYAIVEGEPGIFPDPVARLLRRLGRLARRRQDAEPPPPRPDGPEAAGTGADDERDGA